MVSDSTENGDLSATADEKDVPPPQYVIEPSLAAAQNRSLAAVIAARRCYTDQQADDNPVPSNADVQPFIDTILEHCADTPDYLLPDTPLKEAVFRTILAKGNKPMTAQEISESLSAKWAMTAYPRDVSIKVIQRLLDHSESYCIVKVGDES